MRKIWIVVGVVLAVLVFAGMGMVAIAQAQDGQPYWPGGHMMTREDGEGPMHDYMIAALSEALNLTPARLEARLASGETAYEIALAQGIPADQAPEILQAAHLRAIESALADGVIDQQAADWMKAHGLGRGSRSGAGPGHGSCSGIGQRNGTGMMRGSRR